MKEMVPVNSGKTKIDAIIKEEMAHIKLLGKELLALNRKSERIPRSLSEQSGDPVPAGLRD
jgi:hypothetical protein